MQQVAPISEKHRLPWIDAARGIAIFGIFIVNIGAFSAPYFLYGGENEAWTRPIDNGTLAIIDMFFQASFYTLFSLLFGFGVQIMKERLAEKERNVYRLLFRRFLLLAVFGIVHAFMLWHGDILFTYGIIGIILLLLLPLHTRTLIRIAAVILGGNVLIISMLYYSAREYLHFSNTYMINDAIVNYRSNDLRNILAQNYTDWQFANGSISFLLIILIVLPLFLFGVSLARKGWLHNPIKYGRILRKWWFISFVGFIAFKIIPYLFGNPLWFSYIQDNVGGSFSALFYIISVTLFANTPIGRKMLKPFIYVGRMSLSNYIFQSLFGFFFFYGIGFGFYHAISPLPLAAVAIVVFAAQAFFSKWWLSRFYYGPLEWVWRTFTYMKKQPFIRR